MGMDFVKRPLWTRKLSEEKLHKYLNELNEFELRGTTNSELLLDTAETWYSNKVGIEGLLQLSVDIYKEATYRWYETTREKYELNEEDRFAEERT